MSNIVVSTSSFDVQDNPPLQRLITEGVRIITNPHGRKLTETEIGGLLNADTIGVIAGVEPLTEAVLEAAPALRVISRCGTGVDNVDLDAAQRRNIAVRRTPEAPAAAVAELALGLMLTSLRRIAECDKRLRIGDWYRPPGRLLGDCVIGLVGLGAIGRRVAELCRAFGATVLAADPDPEVVPEGVELTDLDDLLGRADIISLHIPLTADTVKLIGRAALSRMRPGAVLVNTSRAGVVDEKALAGALVGQDISAALDVFENEPYHGPLSSYDNTVLTPHIGSNTRETRRLMELEAAENLVQELHDAGLITTRETDV